MGAKVTILKIAQTSVRLEGYLTLKQRDCLNDE